MSKYCELQYNNLSSFNTVWKTLFTGYSDLLQMGSKGAKTNAIYLTYLNIYVHLTNIINNFLKLYKL